MVKREELLKDLKDYLEFEEYIVHKLCDFYLALDWKGYVPRNSHGFIQEGLITLRDDTEKHVKMVSEMIKYMGGSSKNEF